jgi:hypothetical protein
MPATSGKATNRLDSSWVGYVPVPANDPWNVRYKEGAAAKKRPAAIAEMQLAIDVKYNSSLLEIEPSAFENVVEDEFPAQILGGKAEDGPRW